jgi:uncharacterized protein (UPF0332 family)
MCGNINDYIHYRIAKSQESSDDAKFLAENGSWNACVNRLYYTCFYPVSALLLKNEQNAQTHSGIKSLFGLHFVKTKKITKEEGQLYSDLMDWRQKGDYGDMFDFEREDVEPLIDSVSSLLSKIETLIKS